MKVRFLLQVLALFLCGLLVAALTLAVIGKVSTTTFWLLVVFAAIVAVLLHKAAPLTRLHLR